MPGNDVGDRVHNFFPQDNLSQGQHHPQIVDGNWPVVNNNFWVGSPGQVGVLSSNTKNYNLLQSDAERGQSSHPLHGPHGLNFTQSIPRPEFAKNQSQSQQLNLNGYMYGNHFHQTRQNETNFLAVDTASDQHNSVSRGLSMYESHQGSAPQQQTKSLLRSETSESPVSFDLFGNQQLMNHPQSSMLQSLQRQQSGFNDMQQLQQQLMLRKMQELQRQQQLQQLDARQQLHRQQQLRQLDARQHNAVNPISPFGRQLSGGYPSPLIDGTPSSDSLTNASGVDLGNMNWLQRASPVMEGSSNGLVFSSNLGQAHRLMDLVPQEGDQSLYGVPVSSSKGNVSQLPQIAAEKPSVQHMATFGSSLPNNQYTAFAEQDSMQDHSLISRHRFPSENLFGHTSGQALTPAMNIENLQQVNPMQRNESPLETRGSEDLASQEKTSGHVATSQNEVSLDPTEERILFGSDDNIWAAFGKSPNMTGDACSPYDSGGPNGFSSFQSGTWSALMQSAVAETSSSDIGQQEEWSGLNYQNNVVSPGNQHPTYSEKQQASFRNDMPSMNSSVLPPDNSSMNNNYQNILGVQLGKNASELGQRPPADSSQRLIPSSEEGSRWSNSGLAEASSIHGNTSHSLDAETNMKSISGPWTAVQSRLGQQYGKPNGWNALGSVAPSGNAAPSMHESENSSRHSQGSEQKRVMQEEVVHGNSLWSSRSMPSSNVEVEHGKSLAGSLLNRDGFSVSNAAATPYSSTARFSEETSIYPSNNHQLNYWKNVNPLVKAQGSESVERSQHLVNKDNQAVDSSFNSCDKAEVRRSEMENYTKENSSDSYRSNLSRHNSAGGLKENGSLKENVFSDASDSRSLPSGKQKSFNQISRKNSGPRKFQYHPMGNLDEAVEPSFGMKQQPSHSLAMPQLSTHFGQPKSFGQIPKSSLDLAKEQSADQNDAEGIDDSRSSQSLPGHIQNATMPFNRSVHTYTSKDSQSSQNMLELLHKVDQSRDQGSVMQFSSSGRNLSSEMPEVENSDGSEGRLQQSHSSASQGFGLQLGPPSNRAAVPNQFLSPQSSLQTANTLHQSQATLRDGENGQTQFAPTSVVQSLPPRDKPLGELENNRSGLPGLAGNNAFLHKLPGNFSSASNSGSPYSRSQFQYQQMVRASGQVSTNQHDASHSLQKDDFLSRPSTGQIVETSMPDAAGNVQSVNSRSLGGTSQQIDTNDAHARGSAPPASARESVPVSQPLSASGISRQGTSLKMSPTMWTNVPGQRHLLGAQFHKVTSHVPQLHQPKVLESTSYASHKQGDQDVRTGRNGPSELGASSMNKESPGHQVSTRNINAVHKMDESQGAEPVSKNVSDGSPANSASMQQDLEAFGRSLKSNKFFHQNYSLLNQMQAMKSTESDPNNKALKKMKGRESSVEGQQEDPRAAQSSENSTVIGDVTAHHSAVPSGDSKMLSFLGQAGNEERKASIQHGNVASQNMRDFSQDESRSNPHGNNSVSVRVERSQISPQMAPSWFNQYGTFRNGQMLAMHDAHKASIMNTAERPLNLGKSSSGFNTLSMIEQVNAAAVDTGHIGNISTPISVAIEHFSSLQSPALNITRPKKRKRATSHLNAWHKEVSQGSSTLQTISMTEANWAKAANRLTEKIEDEVELIEDGPPMLRAKRRLTSTTQLMQHLLCPPKYVFLSADANSHNESVAYSLSRLALGDACGLVSHPSSDPDMPHDGVSLLSDKCKKSERVNDRHLIKVMEDFMERARKLENDFLRMDKRASVVDLRVECQELEKFSVINRFAKFHGRGQAENGDVPSSSDGAANALKPCPQRYVTALPVPRNLPDRVQCLSL